MKTFTLIVLAASSLFAQAPPASANASPPANANASPTFEVASIKINPAGGNGIGEVAPGRLNVNSATLATCIKWAYGVQGSQIIPANSDVARMLNSERYDIVAKSATPVPESELKLMMQTLLADRFHLVLQKQSKEMQVHALVVEKNGIKFQASQEEGKSEQLAKSKVVRQWKRTTMAQLADSLSDAMQAPVLDQTGLSGKYDFGIDLTPFLPAATSDERPDIQTMMVTAIREQLGLRFESRRAPVEVLVIERLEKPTAN